LNPVIGQVGPLGNDLSTSVARVELVGFPEARSHARRIFTATRAVADMYRDRELACFHAGAQWRKLPSFDGDMAEKALTDLESTIESFIDVVRLSTATKD